MSGFLTPHFTLTQDDSFVQVRIRLPHLRASTEGEFYVLDKEFKFFLKPYFLRLTFQQSLIEDGRERAEQDLSSGVLTVWLPKATHGEHFEGLDMLTELLRRPTPKARTLIEVVSSTEAVDAEQAGGEDTAMSDDLGIEVDQELPEIRITSEGNGYGFNRAHRGVFTGLEGEELVQISDPESASLEARREARLAAEDAAFSSEHYMADLVEDELPREAMSYTPWWLSPAGQEEGESSEAAASASGSAAAQTADDLAPSAGAAAGAPFGIGSEYQATLLQLPRKEFLLTANERRIALCGLVDLLFAYAYDVRTTQGESTVESGWTVRRLSSLLSCLETFETVLEAAVACVRRSLCYPLMRHLELSRAVLADVSALLRLGRPGVLRALLDVRRAVQTGREYGYLLNRIWVDDYCVWLQQLPERWLGELATELDGVAISRDMLAWPLAAYEELARESLAEMDTVADAGSGDGGATVIQEVDGDEEDDDEVSSESSDVSSDSDDETGPRATVQAATVPGAGPPLTDTAAECGTLV